MARDKRHKTAYPGVYFVVKTETEAIGPRRFFTSDIGKTENWLKKRPDEQKPMI